MCYVALFNDWLWAALVIQRRIVGGLCDVCCGRGGGGYAVAHLDEAQSYKPEGREFDSGWYHCNYSLI
jgi:hypothetical protein